MTKNFSSIQLSSDESSLKLWLEGSTTITVPARGVNDFKNVTATIPHAYGSDDLLVAVGFRNQFTDDTALMPFIASGGTYAVAFLDSTNLYIEAGDSSTIAQPNPLPFVCQYRLFIP